MNTPVHPQIQRTLAAIVVTDAVGFSKRMSQDEDKALAMINRDLQLICELCEFFEGQILKTVGDGALMYFVSAVQAAACAVEIQKTFASFKKANKGEEHFTHRVGVHLGDIFFNQQDMMGTGVNIAARLESEAKPGGICMSQVVFDVVKSRLELDASYIGELSLKNIGEAVPAYHVWPLGMRPEEADDTTEAVAPLRVTPLHSALKALSEHRNAQRIKKLLYGSHQAQWENDSAVLEGISLKLLLESLTNRNPTLEECRANLYGIVGTLNRQDEYSQVAEVILDSLSSYYAEAIQLTVESPRDFSRVTFEAGESELVEGQEDASGLLENPIRVLCQDIAERLDKAPDTTRLKKMLYCLCYDTWENNNERIAQMETAALIEKLYQQVTTRQGLQNRLRTILLRLNRRAKYAPIANMIFQECQILYPEVNSQISMPGSLGLEDSAAEDTQLHLKKKSDKAWPPAKQAGPPPMPPSACVRSAAYGS